MTAPVADLVRRAPQLAAPAPSPKPAVKFDDVLAGRRERAKPKADSPEPSRAEARRKSERSEKPDAADAEPKTDEAEVTDADAAEAEESSDAKPVKKAKATKDEPEDAEAEAGEEDAPVDVVEIVPTDAAVPVAVAVEEETPADADVTEEVADPDAIAGPGSFVDPTLAAQMTAAPVQAPTAIGPTVDTSAVAAPDVSAVAAGPVMGTQNAPAIPTAAEGGAATAVADKPALKPHATDAMDADAQAEAFVSILPDVAKAIAEPVALPAGDAAAALQAVSGSDKPAPHFALPSASTPVAAEPPRTVAEDNVDRIVTSVRGELLTKGGTMNIRLDPPTLGAINIQIDVADGVVSASLQTSNDEATRLLSHNLAQLKNSLEAVGVTVDRIQVKQAAPTDASNNATSQNNDGDRGQNNAATQDQSARQEQQRREMLQRMWAKLSGNGDPLDLVA